MKGIKGGWKVGMFKELDIRVDKVKEFENIFKKWAIATDWMNTHESDKETYRRYHLLGIKMDDVYCSLESTEKKVALLSISEQEGLKNHVEEVLRVFDGVVC